MRKEIPAPGTTEEKRSSVFQQLKKPKHKVVVVKKEEPVVIKEEPFSFPTVEDLPKQKRSKKAIVLIVVEALVGLFFSALGIINSGSFYQTAIKYEGSFASVFYAYQLGALFTVIGVVIIYDTIKRV